MEHLSELYEVGKELGSGHFSKVRLGVRKSDGLKVAVKIIKKPGSGRKTASKQTMIDTEIAILKKVNHRAVVKLFDIFEDDEKLYLVMEILEGGELFDRIVAKGHFDEENARHLVYDMLDGVKHLHDLGIAHRDLKPENLLMVSKDLDDPTFKITDFGLSKIMDAETDLMKTPCGTPGYIAPEILRMRGYDAAVDLWSIGVMTYILLCGFPPFYADNDQELFVRIRSGKFQFLKPYWDPISDEAKDFVSKLLVTDPKQRLTCATAFEHPWLAKHGYKPPQAEPPKLGKGERSNSVAEQLGEWNAKRKLKAVMKSVVAINRMELNDKA